jgi:hypothetical protein
VSIDTLPDDVEPVDAGGVLDPVDGVAGVDDPVDVEEPDESPEPVVVVVAVPSLPPEALPLPAAASNGFWAFSASRRSR